ncbi:hypothetical protein KSX_72520 [Ktedonospora formicarum]|uniref:Uncharacterized protein n=2 Tax=Ktedonospora formicarum TaxID=2778364 RepID=A0A8J3ICZ9_9CHLR|nr:hypothetical protein KSX_72520 [Ktedonospora formicarum]
MYLHEKVLVWSRGLWLLLTAAMLACLPPDYQMLQCVCDGPANCSLFTPKAPPTKVLAMHVLCLELSDFVIISLCIQVVVTLVLLTMGTLTFWHRSGTPLSLITSIILNVPGSTGMFFCLGGRSFDRVIHDKTRKVSSS